MYSEPGPLRLQMQDSIREAFSGTEIRLAL